jgi:hypothetical protein
VPLDEIVEARRQPAKEQKAFNVLTSSALLRMSPLGTKCNRLQLCIQLDLLGVSFLYFRGGLLFGLGLLRRRLFLPVVRLRGLRPQPRANTLQPLLVPSGELRAGCVVAHGSLAGGKVQSIALCYFPSTGCFLASACFAAASSAKICS